ncbi:hypothetical protein RHSIM_Rhsim03G0122100 [Rhododendron simsii]|uniref:Retrotransposon Copia-like N-terminal domain-containing protein n=1 Tax=Rhododendron simsii TaxID=118357 RepID=A0A834LU82_RHOSS|nr:hypothetical protein RHSIM_Rhsim03G0122100 [Rhododendron simsii]
MVSQASSQTSESSTSTTSTTYLPHSLSFLIANFQSFITVKLDSSNYFDWKTQVENALKATSLFHFVDGSSLVPSPSLDDTSGVRTPNLEFANWNTVDRMLLSCLVAMLTPLVLPHVFEQNWNNGVVLGLYQRDHTEIGCIRQNLNYRPPAFSQFGRPCGSPRSAQPSPTQALVVTPDCMGYYGTLASPSFSQEFSQPFQGFPQGNSKQIQGFLRGSHSSLGIMLST